MRTMLSQIGIRQMTRQRINMDLDSELWKQAKRAAVGADLSLREWVSAALEEKLVREASMIHRHPGETG